MPSMPSRGRAVLFAILGGAAVLTGSAPAAVAASPVPLPSALVPGTVNRSTIEMRATYDVDATLRVAARRLTGRVTITATNGATKAVDRVRLNTTMGPLGSLAL